MNNILCLNCGKQLINSQTKFCCKKCSSRYDYINKNKKESPVYNRICEHCGNHFIAKKSHKRFCTRICKALKRHYTHYKPRFYRWGKHPNHLKGKLHPAYKERIIASGYVYIKRKNHPFANKSGNIREHRVVIEGHLGRYLTKEEIVHHIDFDKSNNKLENLHLFKNRCEHIKYHYFLRKIVNAFDVKKIE